MPMLMVCVSEDLLSVLCHVAQRNQLTPEAAFVAMAEGYVCLRAGEPRAEHTCLHPIDHPRSRIRSVEAAPISELIRSPSYCQNP